MIYIGYILEWSTIVDIHPVLYFWLLCMLTFYVFIYEIEIIYINGKYLIAYFGVQDKARDVNEMALTNWGRNLNAEKI